MYRPREPFATAMMLQNPVLSKVKGVNVKTYSDVDVIHCSFKSFGGTESTSNDTIKVINTANVETWYRPDITAESRFLLDGKAYEVIGEPENISMRNQFLKFKVKEVKGGA